MKTLLQSVRLSALLLSIPILSCSNDKAGEMPAAIPVNKSSHSWFYFTEHGFSEVRRLQDVPRAVSKPWTQAVRISDMSCASPQTNDTASPNAYAVVNRLGILKIADGKPALYPDESIFDGRSAGNLVFFHKTPLYSVYKNAFFNDTAVNRTSVMHPFLIQFSVPQSVSIPVVNADNLGLEDGEEVTAFVWDGQHWTCSVKRSGTEKIEFSYVTFQMEEELTAITPASAEKNLLIKETDVESFRRAKRNFDFADAPERLKTLFAHLPKSMSFEVKCRNAGGHSPVTFVRSAGGAGGAHPVYAEAILSPAWAAAVFSDGSVFIQGAPDGRPLIKRGKVTALKLPKLPAGFQYGAFALSGAHFYAAWEQTSFYETAQSGFIRVNLDTVLADYF
ncbi:MAG: hypothetical protein ACTTKL_03010 [Treponema sp.]